MYYFQLGPEMSPIILFFQGNPLGMWIKKKTLTVMLSEKKYTEAIKMNEKETAMTIEKSPAADAGGEKQELYTINQVALALSVHQQTLRNWERKKLLIPLRVGARRIYTAKHLELCKKIKEYSGKGVSLKGIKELLNKI